MTSSATLPIEAIHHLSLSGETSQRRLKIALVTAFPPSQGDLNEYGYHLARAMQDDPRVELTILADEILSGAEDQGFDVHRCWRFNSLSNPARLLREIRKINPDVVWFNIGFSTFARSPLAAFSGITIPALVRRAGFYTHITLHTVFERIDLQDAGVKWKSFYRLAGRAATRFVLAADDVTVLLPSFRHELVSKYEAEKSRVHFRPHGIFSDFPGTVASQQRRAENIILAFGYWGTYKRVEPLLQAMNIVEDEFPNTMLLVAGKSHPSTPDYLESLRKQWGHRQNIHFLGYVPEQKLREMFNTATILALPYSSAAGVSGVVHQGCQYGVPMVAADIPEICESAAAEKIRMQFYRAGDANSLAVQLIRLLRSQELRQELSEHNMAVARTMQLSNVMNDYLNLFQRRTGIFKMQAKAA